MFYVLEIKGGDFSAFENLLFTKVSQRHFKNAFKFLLIEIRGKQFIFIL